MKFLVAITAAVALKVTSHAARGGPFTEKDCNEEHKDTMEWAFRDKNLDLNGDGKFSKAEAESFGATDDQIATYFGTAESISKKEFEDALIQDLIDNADCVKRPPKEEK